MQVLEFLKEKTGLNFEFINEDRAKELLDGKSIDGVNAFVKGDTAYFINGSGRKFNTDIASEEMLHPFVASIRKENAEAFESLRKDARKAFPVLAKQIESTYKSNVQEELVTQALSRAFRKDYEENPNHNAIKDLITKFWNYVKGWFRNFGDTPIFSDTDRLYAQDLSETITIENLAKLINSELLLGNSDRINRIALNQTQYSNFSQSISYIPYKRTGEIINSIDKGKSICNATQMLCIEMIGDAFNGGDISHNVKAWPVSIEAKSPLEDSTIEHSTTIVKVDGSYYLFDMPQSEFITPTGNTFTQYGKTFNEGVIGEFRPRLIPIIEESISSSYSIDGESLKRTMDTF